VEYQMDLNRFREFDLVGDGREFLEDGKGWVVLKLTIETKTRSYFELMVDTAVIT
jgi:hypothetical protein